MDLRRIIEAKAILDEAIHVHQPTHIFGLLSGGHDSLCATHIAVSRSAWKKPRAGTFTGASGTPWMRVMQPGGIVLSFGWQSVGMGKGRGYETIEIALINHGGAHNDTVCMAERKIGVPAQASLLLETANG